jgi:hypothetical protein
MFLKYRDRTRAASRGSHHPGQGQNCHRNRSRPQQDPRTFLDCGPGGQNIVDKQNPLSSNVMFLMRRESKGPLHIAPASRPPKITLSHCAPDAQQQIRNCRTARLPGHGKRQQRSLVIATPDQTRPMERDRRDHIALCQKFAAGPGKPSSVSWRRVGSVGVLVRKHKSTAGIVVAKHGPGPCEGGTFADTCTAQQFFVGTPAGIEFERRTTTGTERRRQPYDLRPARWAEPPRRIGRYRTRETQRRQHGVEHDATRTAETINSPGCDTHGLSEPDPAP